MNINKYKYLVLTLIFPVVSYAKRWRHPFRTQRLQIRFQTSKWGGRIQWFLSSVLFPLCLFQNHWDGYQALFRGDGQRAVGKRRGTLLACPFVAVFMLVLIKDFSPKNKKAAHAAFFVGFYSISSLIFEILAEILSISSISSLRLSLLSVVV